MKKSLSVFSLLCCIITTGFSQPDETAGTLKNIQQIPSFTIYTVPDSTAFTHLQLQKNKPLVLIFFNPDCDHCQKETQELVAHKDELQQLQIVMTSALPYHLLKEFYLGYNVSSMPNVKMGQDINFTLGSIYKPARYPSIYIYDAKGNLAKVYAGHAGVAAILEATK